MMSPQFDPKATPKINYVKKVIILGSTGSIGRSTLDVIDQHRHRFDLYAIAANSRIDILEKQYFKYSPEYICVLDEQKGKELQQKLKKESVHIIIGETDMLAMIAESKSDMVVNAIVGSAGLMASLATIKAGINLALANKESLVTGGPLFKRLLKEFGSKLFSIDSEHSAIWQLIGSTDPAHI
ncbi:hypothetical protein IID19_04100 [Patescibacteria group bacterium]|nr:hypothetical protein [Patescibacteria group bacterium]